MNRRGWTRVNLALLAGFFLGSLAAYDRLPARYPAHFDLAGTPDRWEARSLVSWMILPLVAACVTALVTAVARWSDRRPELWNVPDKKRFLELPPEARAPVIERLKTFTAQVMVVSTVILMAVQAGIYRASVSSTPRMPVWIVAIAPAATVVLLLGALRMNARIGTEIRDAHRRLRQG